MYQAQSKQENKAYIFDESKLSSEALETHPKLRFHGKVIETLKNVSLRPYTAVIDSRLIEILDDCITEPVRKYAAHKCYDNAIGYICGLLEIEELMRNDYKVSVHVVDVSK